MGKDPEREFEGEEIQRESLKVRKDPEREFEGV